MSAARGARLRMDVELVNAGFLERAVDHDDDGLPRVERHRDLRREQVQVLPEHVVAARDLLAIAVPVEDGEYGVVVGAGRIDRVRPASGAVNR